ncbi:hypothetical protein SAMN05216177_110190 [Ectopseudomonas toyotomiensis]|jgi:hypothetical protein|uniref:Uncharacterized protein n=1 Tax=Ectopseudomonas toyotomiensis TaxID=554344 RepID=A0A1I5XEI7_9GAMM|nr:hypothetical protein SAMN05216177_110190 [Pseudomonas toyotomiensis]
MIGAQLSSSDQRVAVQKALVVCTGEFTPPSESVRVNGIEPDCLQFRDSIFLRILFYH